MKEMNSVLKWYLILVALSVLICFEGCTTARGLAGKSIATAQVTVDKTMQGWARYVVIHGVTEDKQNGVRLAYAKYQLSMKLAKIAYADFATTNDRTAWDNASKILEDSLQALLLLVQVSSTQDSGLTNQVIIKLGN